MLRAQSVLVLASALGTGVVAGVLIAFSTFVMRALQELPPAQGIAAMQSINIVIVRSLFIAVLFGTALACVALAGLSITHWEQPASGLVLLASLLYLAGPIGVTIAFNVPLNDALAKLDASTAEAAAAWSDYVSRWLIWNHVRSIAALASCAAFIVGWRQLEERLA